jgi:hypothetical protein
VRDLAKYGSDLCPLVLQTNMANLKAGYIFRCDKAWFDVPEFNEKSWHEKIKFMRRKIRGGIKIS